MNLIIGFPCINASRIFPVWRTCLSRLVSLAVLTMCYVSATAQVTLAPSITTIAGNGSAGYSGDGGAAINAQLNEPTGSAVDSQGNVYISDASNLVIREIYAGGIVPGVANPVPGDIYTIAGNGSCGYSGDGGPAINSVLCGPWFMRLDNQGNLYFADASNFRFRVIYRSGTLPGIANPVPGYIYTIAGNGTQGLSGNGGPALNAEFVYPWDVAFDSYGNIYLLDNRGSVRVLYVSGTIPGITNPVPGYIYAIAGNNQYGYSGDGVPATNSSLYDPQGIAIDSHNNIYIGDTNNGRVRMIYAGGSVAGITNPIPGYIYTYAGDGALNDAGDGGPAINAELVPVGMSFDAVGNLYVVSNIVFVRKIDTNGIISTVAGNGTVSCSGGGLASQTGINPASVSVDVENNLYISDQNCNSVAKISSATQITFPPTNVLSSSQQTVYLQLTGAETLVGITDNKPNDFPAPTSTNCTPGGSYPAGTVCTVPITFIPQGAGLRQALLQVTTSAGAVSFPMSGIGIASQPVLTPGIITTVAGNGSTGFSGDNGLATSAGFFGITSAKVDGSDNLYIVDTDNNRIRMVSSNTGFVKTVAGDGTSGYNTDGILAINAELNSPYDIALDGAGNLYIADTYNNRIRKVDSNGIITTVAGNGLAYGTLDLGDGGPATSAGLSLPMGVTFDKSGNFYIADTNNRVVRKVNAAGIITTVAGSKLAAQGTVFPPGFTGDGGPATQALLDGPMRVAVDNAGNLYISDRTACVIRKVDTLGIISTIAGDGPCGYNGNPGAQLGDNGPATGAQLVYPTSATVDAAGNVYIADSGNNRIRKVDTSGIITTVAGNGGTVGGFTGYTGDNIAATMTELNAPTSIAVDPDGNLLIADTLNERVRKVTINQSLLPYATPTSVGTSDSTDGPGTITISNNGNAPLTFPSPSMGTNPSIASSFAYDGGSTCPLLSPGSSDYTLAPGASCNYLVDFVPSTGGSITGSLVLTTDNLTTPTETVTFTGTGSQLASSTSLSSSTDTAQPTTLVTLTATVSGPGTIPSGTVTFTETTSSGSIVTLGTETLTNGIATQTSRLALGLDTITATYNGSPAYTASTSNDVSVSVTLVINPPPVCPVPVQGAETQSAAQPNAIYCPPTD